ncbi:hypothetical protein [Herbidospora daliensis]|uniref:hypothetical protein n=1 Tax=Herbidospora daliensis TaxID=295585 RepID=UPI0007867EBC|nr:hypothetical protein [Herbidospora daliensis]
MIDFVRSIFENEPNWVVVTFIGAVIGATVQRWAPAGRLLFDRGRRRPMLGAWHECHYTFDSGREVIGRGHVVIRRGVRHRLIVTIRDERRQTLGPGAGFEYEGQLTEEDHLLVVATEVLHRHTLVVRYLNPLVSKPEPVVGIWLVEDHDKNPAAGVSLLTRNRLTDEDAAAMLRSHSAAGRRALRIKPYAGA